MDIKPIKKKFEHIVDAVAKYNPEKKRSSKRHVKPERKTLPRRKVINRSS